MYLKFEEDKDLFLVSPWGRLLVGRIFTTYGDDKEYTASLVAGMTDEYFSTLDEAKAGLLRMLRELEPVE